jgi:tight adherence protein C
MVIILVLALLFAAAAAMLMARALAMPRMRAAHMLGKIDAYGFTTPADDLGDRASVRSTFDALASSIGARVAARLGALREAELRMKLTAAGMYTTPPRRFMGYRLLAAAGLPLLWLWLSSTSAYSGGMTLLGTLVALPLGWIVPMTLVNRRIRNRFERIDYELPELIDQLVVTVEAGLGFNGSMQVASQRLTGPLGDEVRLVMQEQSMGLSSNEALRSLLARCDTPAMRSFVRSVLQGETLGVSIGQIMRELATDMRKRRRAAAEERAQKAPIKILFPLVFLIFPAMFVILLGPAIFSFLEAIKGA